jgi:uncharacterized protein YuzE
MRFEYDKEANALYIYLRGKIPAGGAACTVELAPGVYLDADRAGRILGVEFLDFAAFQGFLERNGGKVDIPEHVGDIKASKLTRHPEYWHHETWELQWMLYALKYTDELEEEGAIAAAVEDASWEGLLATRGGPE